MEKITDELKLRFGFTNSEETVTLSRITYENIFDTTDKTNDEIKDFLKQFVKVNTLNKIILPLIRRVMPSIIANEICGVQRMDGLSDEYLKETKEDVKKFRYVVVMYTEEEIPDWFEKTSEDFLWKNKFKTKFGFTNNEETATMGRVTYERVFEVSNKTDDEINNFLRIYAVPPAAQIHTLRTRYAASTIIGGTTP